MASKLIRFFNSKGFAVFVFALMSVILFTQADHQYGYTGEEKSENCIVSDGSGYYAYLPQYIVYPDSANFSFTYSVYLTHKNAKFFDMLTYDAVAKKMSTKFYAGTALLQSPFYYVAHKLHQWNGWHADGYHRGYRFSIQIAAIFYWLIGVIALFKLLQDFGFQRFTILVGIIIITFGTNLNQYASYWVTMSHVYSFSMVSCFIYLAHFWAKYNKSKHLILLLIVLGLIAIIRPVNGLIFLIVPFFFGSFQLFFQRLKELFITRKFLILSIGLIAFAFVIYIQLWTQFQQSGSFKLYTYTNEGFTNWSHPEFWNVLFSYHKGFFVYAPVMFLLFFGSYFFIRQAHRYFLIGWFLTVFIWLYAISSWWSWNYGGGLGMRAMIEMLPLFIFPIVYLFERAQKWSLIVYGSFAIIGIFFYQLFQFQFNNGILDCCQMDKSSFWNVFMKTDERHKWMVDYENKREKLDNSKKKDIDFIAEFDSGTWNVKRIPRNGRLEPVIYENLPILIYHNDSLASRIKGRISGQIKLDDPKCNPFVSIRYLNEQNLVEESIFTIGSRIENPFEFEQFEVDINHVLKGKNIRRIEFVISLGGCTPAFKHVKFVKYE